MRRERECLGVRERERERKGEREREDKSVLLTSSKFLDKIFLSFYFFGYAAVHRQLVKRWSFQHSELKNGILANDNWV